MCDDYDFEEMMAMAGAFAEEMEAEQKKQIQNDDIFDLDKENMELENVD